MTAFSSNVDTYEEKVEKMLSHPALEGAAYDGIDSIANDGMEPSFCSLPFRFLLVLIDMFLD